MKTGWVTKRLGEVCEVVTPPLKLKASEYMSSGMYPIVSQDEEFICGYTNDASGVIKISHPVVIFGDHTKAVKYVDFDFVQGADGVKILRPNSGVDSRYLFYVVLSTPLRHLGYARHFKLLKQVDLNFPESLAEQKRIVAKIDAAFEKIDKLKANAERNLANAKELFQSALNEAMRSKPGWVEKRLGEVCESVLGKMLDRQKNKGNPEKYLRNVNVRWGTFDLSDLYEMGFEDDEQERYGLRSGDLVMCEGGEPGRCAVWTGTPATMKFQKALHRIRCGNTIDPYYLYYYFRNISCSGVLQSYFAGRDATIKHLTGQLLKRVKIVFPSIEEQHQIVERLDRESKLCSRLQANYTRLIADCAEMRQAVLKEAFEGRL